MRDGVRLHTVILVPKGAKRAPILLTRTPYDANGLTSHAASAHLGPDPAGLRQRHRRHRRGRLHPRGAGRARQVRLGGRLRHEPAAAGAAEPDAGGPRHRHVRHHRVAREEHPRDQRQGRHPGDLLRRLPAAHGARRPASGAEGLGAHEPDGGRLDGRRLVPQRRLPPADDAVHLRPGGDAEAETAAGGPRHFDDYDMYMEAGSAGELAPQPGPGPGRLLAEDHGAPGYDAFWRDQAVDKELAKRPAAGARGDARPLRSGTRRTSTARRRSTARSSRRTRATTGSSWCSAPGITARRSRTATALGRDPLGLATPAPGSASTSSRPFLAHYLKDDAPPMDVAPGDRLRDRHEHLAAPGRVAAAARAADARRADAALPAKPA